MKFVDLGTMPWDEALEVQSKAIEAVLADGIERVHLLEHPHVFTLGRRGQEGNLLLDRAASSEPIAVRRTNRGGDVTYHGPGQLVGYPHLDLRRRQRDLHRYLRNLEEALIETAARFGVRGFRREGLTGVWTTAGKLASIGVGVRQWITLHGFALNVNTDLGYFRLINPCGISDCPMTSLENETGARLPMDSVKAALRTELEQVFEDKGQPLT